MALPTPVNGQITDDAITSNTETIGDAPAVALGNIFMAVSQALANAAHNAVAAQQQNGMLARAAAIQGINLLFTLGAAASPLAAASDAADSVRQAQAVGAMAAAPGNTPESAIAAIEQALDFATGQVFDHTAPWVMAVREAMAALVESLRGLQQLGQEDNLAALKQAALATVLVRMVSSPEQLEQYQKMIELIKGL